MPTRKLDFLDEVDAELRHAQNWYAVRNPRAAERFVTELERAFQVIIEEPERWSKYGRRARYYQLRRFPYLVIYEFDPSTVTVIAVAHTSRRRGYWRRRLR
jgi:plasmid stabilization system protein ParE